MFRLGGNSVWTRFRCVRGKSGSPEALFRFLSGTVDSRVPDSAKAFFGRVLRTGEPIDVKKQTQYANRAKAVAPHQNFGPAISETAKPRCATFSAIKLPDTPRWSEAQPR